MLAITRVLQRCCDAACVLSCVGLAAAQGAKAPEWPTNEQMRHYRSLGDVALAPDAQHVVVRLGDPTADGGKGHLWLIDTRGGAPRQLTYSPDADKRGENGPQWMPDGQSVLFLAKRGEHTQLFQLPMGGGEARAFDLKVMPPVDASKRDGALPPATAADKKVEEPAKPVELDVASYRVSPDGKRIAVVAHDPETPGEKKAKDAKADATWVDHELHRDRLYLMTVQGETLTPVALAADVHGASWSADSTRLVAVTEEPNGADELGPAASAWMVMADDPTHPAKLAALPNTVGPLAWAHDGQRLFYLAQAKQEAPPGVLDLYEYTLASQGVRDLSDGYKGTVGPAEPVPLIAGGVLQTAEEGVTLGLEHYGDAFSGRLKLPFAALSRVASNDAQSGWVFAGSSSGMEPGLYFAPRLGDEPHKLEMPEMVPKGTRSAVAQRISWKSDRYTIDGLLYLPAVSAGKKIPLVVEVHGGPTGAFQDSFCAFCDFLVGQGWAVLRTNPRGSTGYGAAFAAANKNDLGGGDYRDIMAGVDFVLRTEPVDADRMALIGYSYGGEMAGFVETKTARFEAIVSMAPVIDQNSEYGTEKGSWYDQWFYGKPWEHSADAWRQSPIAGAGKAKTPFLLLQGEDDTTDPLGQSEEMYRALRQMRVPVELVTYPRVDHGPLGGAIYGAPSPEPWHGFDARQRMVGFIGKGFGVPAKAAGAE